jgi:hypothetical protein
MNIVNISVAASSRIYLESLPMGLRELLGPNVTFELSRQGEFLPPHALHRLPQMVLIGLEGVS